MNEGNSRTATTRYFCSVAILVLVVIGTGASAALLSVLADTTLVAKTTEGATVQQATHTGDAIGHLWRRFSGALGALVGFVGGKVV